MLEGPESRVLPKSLGSMVLLERLGSHFFWYAVSDGYLKEESFVVFLRGVHEIFQMLMLQNILVLSKLIRVILNTFKESIGVLWWFA